MNEPLLSIVLPVHNQADHIQRVVGDYLSALSALGVRHEILLVVNGPCRDDSLQVCQSLAAQNPAVRVLSSRAGGWGLAVRLGLAEAKGAVELLLAVGELKILASEKAVTSIEVEEDKLKITRHNDFITLGGKFPRLTKKDAKGRLKEIKRLLLAI